MVFPSLQLNGSVKSGKLQPETLAGALLQAAPWQHEAERELGAPRAARGQQRLYPRILLTL